MEMDIILLLLLWEVFYSLLTSCNERNELSLSRTTAMIIPWEAKMKPLNEAKD